MQGVERQIINSNTFQKDLNSIVEDIEKGLSIRSGGIKLDPDYQRVYQYGEEQASKLIESLIIGIPIPTIYLATDSSSDILMYNVIDGQHRLRSIYNFIKGKFKLKGIEKTSDLNGMYFDDFEESLKNILLYQTFLNFVNIHVQNNPDIEIEIFDRYNANSKPLSRQEIRNAVYRSEFVDYIKEYIEERKNKSYFITNFNITNKRLLDSTLMENLLVGLNIMINGNNKSLSDSPRYAEEIMKKYKENYTEKEKNQVEEKLEMTNKFLKEYSQEGKYLFSKELLDDNSSNYKFQIPNFMLFSLVINKFTKEDYNYLKIKNFYIQVLNKHKELTSNVNTSSTSPIIINKTKEFLDSII